MILYIHGGGWNAGSPEFFDFVGQRFAQEGYRFICGYRLSPKCKYSCQIEDVINCFDSYMRFLDKRAIDDL